MHLCAEVLLSIWRVAEPNATGLSVEPCKDGDAEKEEEGAFLFMTHTHTQVRNHTTFHQCSVGKKHKLTNTRPACDSPEQVGVFNAQPHVQF